MRDRQRGRGREMGKKEKIGEKEGDTWGEGREGEMREARW
jgi:hypothetical protein